MFLESIKMINTKRAVKNLPAHCFVSAQGKTDTTCGTQLTTRSGTGARSMSLLIFAEQIG